MVTFLIAFGAVFVHDLKAFLNATGSEYPKISETSDIFIAGFCINWKAISFLISAAISRKVACSWSNLRCRLRGVIFNAAAASPIVGTLPLNCMNKACFRFTLVLLVANSACLKAQVNPGFTIRRITWQNANNTAHNHLTVTVSVDMGKPLVPKPPLFLSINILLSPNTVFIVVVSVVHA